MWFHLETWHDVPLDLHCSLSIHLLINHSGEMMIISKVPYI